MAKVYDFLIVGAGIAGCATAYALLHRPRGPTPSVIIIERESMPGYHSTGRSAAHYTETNGPLAIRALTTAGRAFYETPPRGFAEYPVLSSRGKLHFAHVDQLEALERFYRDCRELTPHVRMLTTREMRTLNPALAENYVVAGVHQPSMDIDVHSLLQGYIRLVRAKGGVLVSDAPAIHIDRVRLGWMVHTKNGTFATRHLVDAAGAWADDVAQMAGLDGLGLVPKRRTVIQFDLPAGTDCRRWPQTMHVDGRFYFKPDANRIIATPGDETPSAPCDCQPDEFDVAIAAERLEMATVLRVRRVTSKWAGLRSFFADSLPALGPDPREPSFIWVAGQGGGGIKASYGIARAVADLATGNGLSRELTDAGLDEASIRPDRLLTGHGTI